MIILNSQATKLQAKLAADGTSVNFFGVYADNGAAFTPGQNNVASNGTTYVDVVSAPQSGQRQVKSVYAYNGDTVSHTVTLAHYDGTTTRILNIVALVPGASIDLIPGRGLYGAITGPTDATLTQTGTTLGLNLANANTWMAPQTFSAGLVGTLTGTASGNIPMVAPGPSGNALLSDGTAWTSAAPSVAWGNVTGTLASQTDLAAALATKEPGIAPGATSQYWRGDKTWQPINWLTSETDPVFSAWLAATPPLYAESDTLATVTARGAATSVASSFTGGLSALSVAGGSTGKMALTPDVPDSATAKAYTFNTLNALATAGAIHSQWLNNGTALMTLDKAGNLGIGTTSPTQGQLVVNKNIVANQQSANLVTLGSAVGYESYPGIWFGSATPTVTNYAFLADVGAHQTILGAPATGSINLRIGNVTFAAINTNGLAINNGAVGPGSGVGLIVATGNVGIGTTTPGARVEADTGSASTIGAIIKGSSGQTADMLQVQDSTGAVKTSISATGSATATQYRLSALNAAPASATDTGTLGEIRVTSGYIYVCVATNTWVRAALATW
jgi:hypothetical protein